MLQRAGREFLRRRPRRHSLRRSLRGWCAPYPTTAATARSSRLLRALRRDLWGSLEQLLEGNVIPVGLKSMSRRDMIVRSTLYHERDKSAEKANDKRRRRQPGCEQQKLFTGPQQAMMRKRQCSFVQQSCEIVQNATLQLTP